MALIIKLLSFLFYFVIFLVVLTFIPNFPPPVSFSVIDIPPDLPRTGPLTENNAIKNGQRLYEGQVVDPEALQVYKGEVYASLSNGEIVKFAPDGPVQFVTKIGKDCAGNYQEHICGRPLGFQIDAKNEKLYVNDAYYGLWKVDLKDGKKELLISPNVEIEGKLPKMFNFLALADNGDVYLSISSSDFSLHSTLLSFLSDPSGRLLHYNAATNSTNVLLENLYFGNGVVISPDQEFVLVAETIRKTIRKYYINGVNKGKSEIFLSGLPGFLDNMKVAPDGSGAFVTVVAVRDEDDRELRFIAETPLLRKLIARLHYAIKLPLQLLNNLYPSVILEKLIYKIGHLSTLDSLVKHRSAILHYDWDGKIKATYYNNEYGMTDFAVLGDRLYSGNVINQNYIISYEAPTELKKIFATTKPVRPKTAKSKP